MFTRARLSLRPTIQRFYHTPGASQIYATQNRRTFVLVASAAAVGAAIWVGNRRTVHGDTMSLAPSLESTKPVSVSGKVPTHSDHDGLRSLVWGSNSHKTLCPDDSIDEVTRTPSFVEWLDDIALRDLVFHETHAACIDARGDVYQWGEGFFGQKFENCQKPKLTLREKNIIQLQLTEHKLYALSASGKVYTLATDAASQELSLGCPTPSSDSWWGTGWFWGEDETVDFAEITSKEKLGWGERYISIAAGKNHLLALTSKGRTFAHPINKDANQYGQLGFRQFDIPDPASRTTKHVSHINVDLVPKSLADPFAKLSRAVRINSTSSVTDNLADIDDKNIRFCANLFEVPVLRGIEIAQVAAGGRSSFARTGDGRVLAWGANEYGQLGLGSNVALDTIIVPTEVVLWRMASNQTRSKCLNVSAGGDLTAFTVERKSDGSHTTTDFMMCGNGQHGGLGNNSYSNAQGNPIRVKNISGLLQYSEQSRSLQPIRPKDISISPTGHVMVALESSEGLESVGGSDVMVWGRNYTSEIGNGKKSSVAIPTSLNSPSGERLMLEARSAKVMDLRGKRWRRKVKVEQRVVAGYGSSVVYWKIV